MTLALVKWAGRFRNFWKGLGWEQILSALDSNLFQMALDSELLRTVFGLACLRSGTDSELPGSECSCLTTHWGLFRRLIARSIRGRSWMRFESRQARWSGSMGFWRPALALPPWTKPRQPV